MLFRFLSLFLLLLGWLASAAPVRDPFISPLATAAVTLNNDGTFAVNWVKVSLADALQTLAEQAQLNVVISPTVQGQVTLHLNHVSWQEIFDTLALMQGLVTQRQGNILLITQNSGNANPANVTLQAKLIQLRYAKAVELAALLNGQKGSMLSKSGHVSADERTNSLWVQDQPAQLTQIAHLIAQLDVPVKQVMIKAKIVSIDSSFVRELGLRFGTVEVNNSNNITNTSSVTPNGKVNVAIANLGQDNVLDVELAALEDQGKAKVISSPELITADRTPAYIQSGEEVPYQEQTRSGATSIAFRKAVLGLKVTPQLIPGGKVLLLLTVNQDRVGSLSVNGVPTIQTRELQTQVIVAHGATLALGGIYEQSDSQDESRTPLLGSVPLLGHLFKHHQRAREQRELMIFITPKILS